MLDGAMLLWFILTGMSVLFVAIDIRKTPEAEFWMPAVAGASSPLGSAFWFIISIALLVGFICAYPMNWWLVTRNLKHGMMTIRANSHSMHDMHTMNKQGEDAGAGGHKAASHDMAGMNDEGDSTEGGMAGVKHADDGKPGGSQLVGVGAFSVVVFAAALTIVFIFGPA